MGAKAQFVRGPCQELKPQQQRVPIDVRQLRQERFQRVLDALVDAGDRPQSLRRRQPGNQGADHRSCGSEMPDRGGSPEGVEVRAEQGFQASCGRRSLLAAFGAAAAAMTLRPRAASAKAAPPESRALARLVDASLAGADRTAHAGTQATLLGADLVRQWREGLREEVLAQRGAVALVRWDKAIVLQGLAREEGFSVQAARVSGAAFRVALTPRA